MIIDKSKEHDGVFESSLLVNNEPMFSMIDDDIDKN